MKRFACIAVALAGLTGCGPDKDEIARSQLEQIAETWDGGEKFTAEGTDPWGQPYTAKVEKGDAYYTLTVRSNGPDCLPLNRDDITAHRTVQHTPLSKAVAPAIENLGEALGKGLGRGGVAGVREGVVGKKSDDKKGEGKIQEKKNEVGKKQ